MREATQEEREGVEQYIDSIADIAPSKWMAPYVLNKLIGAEVLDKIRAEIEQIPSELTADGRRMIRQVSVFQIIDKYRAERSEEKND